MMMTSPSLPGLARGLLACGFVASLAAAGASKTKSKVHPVVMENMQFSPATLEVKVGDTIEWKNKDLVPHTASASDGTFDSSGVQPGKTWRFQVTRKGKLSYACRFHPTMKGSLDAL